MRNIFAKSLLPRFVALFIAFVALQSAVAFLFTYSLYSSALIEQNVRANEQKLEQITANLETVVEVAVAASNQVCLDYENAELLQKPYGDFYEWYKDRMTPLQKRLESVQSGALYRYDSSVYLFDLDGGTYSAARSAMTDYYGVMDQPWFHETLREQGFLVWMVSDDRFSGLPDTKSDIAVLRAVRMKNGGQSVGVLLVTMQLQDDLRKLFFNPADGQALFLLSEDGRVALGSDQAAAEAIDWNALLNGRRGGSFEWKGGKAFVNVCSIYKTGWRLVQLLDRHVFFREIDTLMGYNLFLNIALAAVVAALLTAFTWRIIRPLRALTGLLKKVGEGNFDLTAPSEGEDELAQIGSSFNVMVRRIQELLSRVRQDHIKREQIQLSALRAQINPHFLLNTLNDIKWMALIQNAKDVAGMLSTLGALLENTLGRRDKFIPLSAEIKNTRDYAQLQEMRFGEKFSLSCEVEEAMLCEPVPILILQPLIENAVMHGFCDMESGGEIHLRGWIAEDETMQIEVRDNGQGMDGEHLEKIREAMEDLYADDAANIGITNVHRRLALSYGPGYGLTLQSAPGRGTIATLSIPKEDPHAKDTDRG